MLVARSLFTSHRMPRACACAAITGDSVCSSARRRSSAPRVAARVPALRIDRPRLRVNRSRAGTTSSRALIAPRATGAPRPSTTAGSTPTGGPSPGRRAPMPWPRSGSSARSDGPRRRVSRRTRMDAPPVRDASPGQTRLASCIQHDHTESLSALLTPTGGGSSSSRPDQHSALRLLPEVSLRGSRRGRSRSHGGRKRMVSLHLDMRRTITPGASGAAGGAAAFRAPPERARAPHEGGGGSRGRPLQQGQRGRVLRQASSCWADSRHRVSDNRKRRKTPPARTVAATAASF